MKFDNLDEEEVEETFYFNYNKKEIAELLEFGRVMKFAKPGDPPREPLEVQMEKLSTPVEESGLNQTENNQQAYQIFQDLILDAYGKKGADNVTFEKTWELRNHFENHVAFVELIFEFLGNPPLAASFIEKCLPSKLINQAKEELVKEGKGLSSQTLSEMVAEADRLQKDPATRIEAGPEAAAAVLGENTAVATLAKSVASEQDVPAKKKSEYTAQDIVEMDDVAFAKLDVQGLPQEALVAAFRRKSG